MGVSTDAHISCGIAFDEGHEFPWGDDDYEDWWRSKHNPRGDSDLSFEECEAIDEAHPLPVEIVNTCSLSCPQYIVAIKGTVVEAKRGYPEMFSPQRLTLRAQHSDVEAFMSFCETYLGIKHPNPEWFLSSYWEH